MLRRAMFRCGSGVSMLVLGFTVANAMAETTARPSDQQIAQILYTVCKADIAGADLALKKTQNSAVKAYASEMIEANMAARREARALLDKAKLRPRTSALSETLAGTAAEKQQDLARLDGAAFDKAYARNEVAYWVTVNGAIETMLVPSTRNAGLKRLLTTRLQRFKAHQKRAEELAIELAATR